MRPSFLSGPSRVPVPEGTVGALRDDLAATIGTDHGGGVYALREGRTERRQRRIVLAAHLVLGCLLVEPALDHAFQCEREGVVAVLAVAALQRLEPVLLGNLDHCRVNSGAQRFQLVSRNAHLSSPVCGFG